MFKLKELTVVAALVLASTAGANAASLGVTTDANVARNTYLAWFSGWKSYFESTNVGATLVAELTTTTGGDFSITKIFAEVYSPQVSSFSQTFFWNSARSGDMTVSAVVPVPGPEAGAGIGALAMGGVAYLLHRRRKMPSAS